MHDLQTYSGCQEIIKYQHKIIQITNYSYQELLILKLKIAILVCIKATLLIICCWHNNYWNNYDWNKWLFLEFLPVLLKSELCGQLTSCLQCLYCTNHVRNRLYYWQHLLSTPSMLNDIKRVKINSTYINFYS